MKKILFAIAAVAALASCSKNEADNNAAGQKAIAFSNLNDKVNSRFANDNRDDYEVYAKSTLAGENTWFINDFVNGTTNIANGGPYYWPAAPATVDFYAWAPYGRVSPVSNYPSITALMFTADGYSDFTVAAPITGLSSGTVDFEFMHMLSKVSINATLTQALQDAGYTITFAFADFCADYNAGTLDITGANPEWIEFSTDYACYSGAKSYMIIPQPVANCWMFLRDVVVSKGGAEVFHGDMSDIYTLTTELANFEQGKHYMLNVTIGASSTDGNGDPIFGSEILFSADLAADWDTVAGIDTPIVQP